MQLHLNPSLRTRFASNVDILRGADASAFVQVAGIVGFAALTAAGAQLRVAVWEVPFTLQTLAVYGSGLFLGWRNGMLAQLLYLTAGLFMPVFAGDGHGLTYLSGAVSTGYLIGYPLAAIVGGWLSTRWNSGFGSIVSLLAASAVLFTCGVIWLHYAAGHATWFDSIDRGWLRFIPIDMLKIVAVASLYAGTRRMTRKDA